MANYRWHTSIALQLERENPEEVLDSYYEACSGILQDARDPSILDDPDLNDLVVRELFEELRPCMTVCKCKPNSKQWRMPGASCYEN